MAEMLSPGVFVSELDSSTIAPTVSNSIGAFAGNFDKGPVEDYTLITTVDELISFYGLPGDNNYNDWYQAYNFLQYGNKLYVARATNVTGSIAEAGVASAQDQIFGGFSNIVSSSDADGAVMVGDIVSFGDIATYYEVTDVTVTYVELDRAVEDDFEAGAAINIIDIAMNGVFEPTSAAEVTTETAEDMTLIFDETIQSAIATDDTYVQIGSVTATADAAAGSTTVTVSDASGLSGTIYFGNSTQGYTFTAVGNDLTVSPALVADVTSGDAVKELVAGTTPSATIAVNDVTKFTAGDVVVIGTDINDRYTVQSVGAADITFTMNVMGDFPAGTPLSKYVPAASVTAVPSDITTSAEYFAYNTTILNSSDYEIKETSIEMTNESAKCKIMSRNPGDWAQDIEVAIAVPADFGTGAKAFNGVPLDDLYEYYPSGDEVGVIVRVNNEIKEIHTVSFDATAKDQNNKSIYIEDVITNQSSLIYIKDNTANDDDIKSYIDSTNGVISLLGAVSSETTATELSLAYDLWDNKEEIDIDIVIANETDKGAAALEICASRQDCIGFAGANADDVVGKKAAEATSNLVAWRTTGDMNENNMFFVACGNYKYQYDRYNDKNRWINVAGDIAGLRAQTSTNRASWWASAGLERGQIKNVKKLAFNPNQSQRDALYKTGINPIVSFPGQGTVMWGQKTLLDKPSSFDRVNVRGLFNTLERSLSKMAKYQVMEFNDNFTRNRIISMIKPFLSSVQAGRGIQDYLVICDTSNNTADVISRNQLIVDIYIKPTYVAEFIHLKFTNAGTNSFTEIVGGQ